MARNIIVEGLVRNVQGELCGMYLDGNLNRVPSKTHIREALVMEIDAAERYRRDIPVVELVDNVVGIFVGTERMLEAMDEWERFIPELMITGAYNSTISIEL